jgi:hypothetical protein
LRIAVGRRVFDHANDQLESEFVTWDGAERLERVCPKAV